MSTTRKKKIKVKWKNLFIFLCILFIFFFGMIKGTQAIISLFTKPNEKEIKVKKETKKDEFEEVKNLEYFNEQYKERYKSYKEKNPSMDLTQVIKNVNMNLDQTPYEYKIKAKNLNTEKILVNKYYYLEEDYVPDNLQTINRKYALSNMRMVNVAKEAFESLSAAAQKEDLNIIAMSTYRSYTYQVNLYNRYKKEDGEAKADTYSGRPGQSEHQTGLAVDVYNKEEDYTKFHKTKEFLWMKDHAHEYGFILRFPEGKENETGYTYESWHYRYVGKDIATYIHQNNITLEEYYATKIKDW